MLLSNFDEYISYARDPEDYARFDGTVSDVMRAADCSCSMAGWPVLDRDIKSRAVEIEVRSASPITAGDTRALEAGSARVRRFVGRRARACRSAPDRSGNLREMREK